MRALRAEDDIFFTETMAGVLEKQGRYEDALFIYKIISDSRPGDESLKARIERLKCSAERGRKA